MVEPVAISAAVALIVKSAPNWLDALHTIFVDQGKEILIEQGKSHLHDYIDKKKQIRHLELALKNAAERGLSQFQNEQDRDRYQRVLVILSEPGSHQEALRREAMRLFTLFESPDLEDLKDICDRSLGEHTVSGNTLNNETDITIYLKSFFEALTTELYIDNMLHEKLSDALRIRAGISIQRSLKEVLETLHLLGEALMPTYSVEQFEKDIQVYTEYMERSLRYLKLLVIVPQDRMNENVDPELNGIFVPPRLALLNFSTPRDSIVSLLEEVSRLVLLGDPGSGKSITTRHLAWSHAAANLQSLPMINTPVLSGAPLPFRIDLRHFVEVRRKHPEYSFFSYFTEVLLRQENISVRIQMFEELLDRRTMLLIFDGLDEVATLEERLKLIEEIEHLAIEYPGNRILITSRSVGYKYACFTSRWFSHAQIQPFDDAQIHMFLERWYMHVLHFVPIPSYEKQELEGLYETLIERPRLHTLAKNPLLLSVIAALHRSKRLPDKRVLVYEECTKLLLEIWSQYRGTDVQWKDLLMTEEDQRACISHLGFVLHKRFQQKRLRQANYESRQSGGAIVDDAPAVFLLREIEAFLESQNLFISVAEQRAEAKRFFRMIQLETGLIVERGTNEAGEALYSFIHRTFQEYFAAMDVYERYQKEEDTTVVSNFLQTHLYDPHWHEVVLLLLGKLKRKPVTAQLLQILDGKIKNQLNNYRDILHNDLFFVCSCLKEDISVEKHLAVQVVLKLAYLIANSLYQSQRSEALEYLTSLKNTRQYGELAYCTLLDLLTRNTQDDLAKMEIAEVVYLGSSENSKEWIQARQMLMEMASSSAIPFSSANVILGRLYFSCSGDLVKQQDVGRILYRVIKRPVISFDEVLSFFEGMLYAESMDQIGQPSSPLVTTFIELLQRPEITFEQMVEAAKSLYLYTDNESSESTFAVQMLLELSRRPGLSLDQRALVACTLYRCSMALPEEKRTSTQILVELAESPHISLKLLGEILQTVCSFPSSKYYRSQAPERSEEYFQILQILREKLLQTTLSFEETLLINEIFCKSTYRSSDEHQLALERLANLSQMADITFEQKVQAIQTFIDNSPLSSAERESSLQGLITLLEHQDLSVEQILHLAQVIHRYSLKQRELYEIEIVFDPRVMQTLVKVAKCPDVSFDQLVSIISFLYKDVNPPLFFERDYSVSAGEVIGGGYVKKEERALAREIMAQLLETPMLAESQRLQLMTIPLTTRFPDIVDLAHSIRAIKSILHEDAAREYFERYLPHIEDFFIATRHQINASEVPVLVELIGQNVLPARFRDALFKMLRAYFPLYWKVNNARTYRFSEEEEEPFDFF